MRNPVSAALAAGTGPNMPVVDFTAPPGEPALAAPDSVHWRVFKNPIALFVGGITAVILELAEPRVRTGVWEHTTFRTDPLGRMQRTGLAAMVTVYGARSVAQKMIAGITRMHAKVNGVTPEGQRFEALEPELMNWVQATASYGFMNAYHHYVRPLSRAERDRFYAEARTPARLYGATGSPASEADWEAQLQQMLPQLRAHPIVDEFLDIMWRTPALPWPLRPLQGPCIRAAIELVPEPVQELLGLPGDQALGRRQAMAVRAAGRLSDHLRVPGHPAIQACRRIGLPGNYLFRSGAAAAS